MTQRTRHYRRAASAWVTALATLAACTDRSPAGPGGERPTPPDGSAGGVLNLSAVTCRASTRDRSVSCDPLGSGARPDIIVGGQDVYVRVSSSNVDYVAATQQFTFDVTVRNLIPQPMGTTDGVTLDPSGVRVFFQQLPTATAGSGAIVVVGDGTATFTAVGQPYYQYNAVLDQYQVSPPRTWTLTVPASVTAFDFKLYVSAPVEYPDGYVEVVGNATVRSGTTRQLTGVVRTAVGNIDSSTTVTWLSGDPTLASVDGTGLVRGLRAGTPLITASTVSGPPRDGELTMNVRPVRRYWTAAAGTTDWHTGANWLPDSIAPTATDTAAVPDSIASIFPALLASAVVGGVEVDDVTPGGTVPSVALGSFDLTASGDVFTTNSASINSSGGQLVLVGTARTLRGTVPRINVTGTYSLDGNATVAQRIQSQAGRITSTSFRLQQNP